MICNLTANQMTAIGLLDGTFDRQVMAESRRSDEYARSQKSPGEAGTFSFLAASNLVFRSHWPHRVRAAPNIRERHMKPGSECTFECLLFADSVEKRVPHVEIGTPGGFDKE